MRFCVIGASGQVGQELLRQLEPNSVVAIDHGVLDVTQRDRVEQSLERVDYDVVINLAAFHDVNACEVEGERAFAVNALGPRNVAAAAAARGKRVVFLSSDYVYGALQERDSPYAEDVPPAPINLYGTSKVAGEQLVRAENPDHLIVRTASLFGRTTSKKGWTFPQLMLKRARAGEPLRVVNDQVMSPTNVHDLVQRLLALVALGTRGTVHVTNSGSCSWYELAVATLELAGVEAKIEPVRSSEFPTRARRPTYSVLTSTRIPAQLSPLRPWRVALEEYLDSLGELRR